MSDKLLEINHENVLAKMNTYLHVWDLVGIINGNVTDEEERNALLDVLEGAGLLIEQLEQVQAENEKLNYRELVTTKANETLGRYVREGKEEIEQLKAANQKLVECLEWYAREERALLARHVLSEVKGNG